MRPYVIVAPPYTDKSAGIRVLHLTCHLMNTMGIEAYMASQSTNPDWDTPQAHQGHLPGSIVIYPEVVDGNPLQAERYIRWNLNRPGYIRGPLTQSADPLKQLSTLKPLEYDYSATISGHCEANLPVFNVAHIDPDIFKSPPPVPLRFRQLFYCGDASRTKQSARVALAEVGKIQLTNRWPAAKPEYVALLQSSRMLLSYSPISSVNYEAVLCGCPVVIVPEGDPRWKREDLERSELGINGIAWGADEEAFERAIATLSIARELYLSHYAGNAKRIAAFVEETQRRFLEDEIIPETVSV